MTNEFDNALRKGLKLQTMVDFLKELLLEDLSDDERRVIQGIRERKVEELDKIKAWIYERR